MPTLSAFLNLTLDGYFAGPKGEVDWAHRAGKDPEWNAFVAENAKSGGTLLLGRKTYEIMVSYWPTAEAKKNDPVVAEGMNSAPKVVFSRSLDQSPWSNTKVMKGDLATEVRKLKQGANSDITILGSGSIVSQLTQAGLIDEYQLVLNPVIIGRGKSLFPDVTGIKTLRLNSTRAFGNGNVVLCYEHTGRA